MDWKLEVVVVPISDVDRAKHFYANQIGFHEGLDTRIGEHARVVQPGEPWNSFIFFSDPDGNSWTVQEKPE